MNDLKILVIVPAYNEEENILKTVLSIKKYKKFLIDYIVINDGSTDETETILKENNFNYINLPFNLGIGAAVQTGYKYAYYNDYDVAVQFDGDGQHDINSIESVLKPLINGNVDMVVGSRFIDNTSAFKSTKIRRFGISLISALIKVLCRKKIKDVTSGYRGVNKKVIRLFANYYPYDFPEPITNYALLKNGFVVNEVGVSMMDRVGGHSSINFLKSIYYMFNVCLSILLFNSKKLGGGK